MGAGGAPSGNGTRSGLKIVVNIFISFIGAGVLGLPFAFRQETRAGLDDGFENSTLYGNSAVSPYMETPFALSGTLEGILTMGLVSFFAVKAMLLIIDCKYTILTKYGHGDKTPLMKRSRTEPAMSKLEDDNAEDESDMEIEQNGINQMALKTSLLTENLTYSDVGYYASGVTGARLVDFAIVISQIGFCCGYLIFISENLNSYLPDIQKETWLILLLPLLFLLTLFRELHKLAFFSLFAQISNLMAFAVVFWFDFHNITHAKKRIHPMEWSSEGFPFFFSVAIYCYEGAGMILSLEYSVHKTARQRFRKYFVYVLVFLTIMYIVFGVAGYMSFGALTNPIITLNLPSTSGLDFAKIVKLCLCFSLFFTYPVMMFPVTDLLERYLIPESTTRYFYENVLRLCLVAATGVIVVGIPSFADLMALIGATCCTLLAFIMPGLFHLLLHRKSLTPAEKWMDCWLILLGIVGAIIGTVDTLSRLRDQADTVVPVEKIHETFLPLNKTQIHEIFGGGRNQSFEG